MNVSDKKSKWLLSKFLKAESYTDALMNKGRKRVILRTVFTYTWGFYTQLLGRGRWHGNGSRMV